MSPMLLIVEDSPTQQYLYRELCHRFGYEAHIVASGEEALSAIALTDYSAVILDIGLPGICGLETIRRIRMKEKGTIRHLPVLALTGNSEPEDKIECLSAGADDYMSKPFSVDAFRKLLLRWTYDSRSPNLRLIDLPAQPDKQLFERPT